MIKRRGEGVNGGVTKLRGGGGGGGEYAPPTLLYRIYGDRTESLER